jgi:sugar lactone lactonase YvrE
MCPSFSQFIISKFSVFYLILMLLFTYCECHFIFTLAGNGTMGYYGDGGPVTSAVFNSPRGVSLSPFGGIYICDTDNSRVRLVFTNGTIITFAGNGSPGFYGDGGPATSASLYRPTGVALSSTGQLYIADHNNNRIRVVNPNGIITTFAGNGTIGFYGDGGPATSAELNYPFGIAVSSNGEVYLADTDNNRIRVVFTNGTIATFAGNGIPAFYGDGGPATSASLYRPTGVALSSTGQLYIADYYNNRIRVVNSNSIITTVAGNGIEGYNGDGGPAISAKLCQPQGVAVSSIGEVYIADTCNNRIRVVFTNGTIATFAGNGTGGYYGDGEPATSATLNSPKGVAVSPNGEVYIADTKNNAIRVVVSSPSTQCSNQGYYESQSYCICSSGYTGSTCQSAICYGLNQTSLKVCSGNGNCIGPDTCKCALNYYGNQCEQYNCFGYLYNDPRVCSERGVCISSNKCICKYGFIGEKCHFRLVYLLLLLLLLIPLLAGIALFLFWVIRVIYIYLKTRNKRGYQLHEGLLN